MYEFNSYFYIKFILMLHGLGDMQTELVRHYLIEPTSAGVRLKGYATEPTFGEHTRVKP